MTRASTHVLQFEIRLKGIKPAIWRRIEVPTRYTFWDLHVAIQDAMGWRDYHLHAFRLRHPESGKVDTIGIPDDEFDDVMQMLAGLEIPVARYFSLENPQADYEYDFGDGWEHVVTLEGIVPREAGTKYPRCTAGGRACPPEDCGGVPGYARLLKIIGNPRHREYQEMIDWVGGAYDPSQFDAAKVRFANPRRRWNAAFRGEGLG